MKKIVFSLAFALLGVFAFANNNIEKVAEDVEAADCVQVTLSCGITGQVCTAKTTAQLIAIVLDADNNLCGDEDEE